MPKELRISAIISLPDDAFEQARLMNAAHPLVTSFAEQLRLAVKQDVPVSARVVAARVDKSASETVSQAADPVSAEPPASVPQIQPAESVTRIGKPKAA